MQTVTVHCSPPVGYASRARAGRVWKAGAHVVKVVEMPKAFDEIAPVQLEALRADRPFFVVEGDGGQAVDVAALRAENSALRAEVAQLTAHLEAMSKPAKGK